MIFSLYVFLGSGATNPEYVVTADDVDKLIAVECIPMDDKGRQVWNKLVINAVYVMWVTYSHIDGCCKCNEFYYFKLGYASHITLLK